MLYLVLKHFIAISQLKSHNYLKRSNGLFLSIVFLLMILLDLCCTIALFFKMIILIIT